MTQPRSAWQDRVQELMHVIVDPFIQDFNKRGVEDEAKIKSLLVEPDASVDSMFKTAIMRALELTLYLPPAITRKRKAAAAALDQMGYPNNHQQLQLQVQLQEPQIKRAKLDGREGIEYNQGQVPVQVQGQIQGQVQGQIQGQVQEQGHELVQGQEHIDEPPRIVEVDKVMSLKSQKQVSEEQMNDFITTKLEDLEVLSIPEHYPTKPQAASSLTEIYYLTQTLPSNKLIPGSHKTLMTENYELALLEGKVAVIYSRIEELKRQGKWSLRQPIRYYDPFVYTKLGKRKHFTWDNLLREASWMAEDFQEGAKYKKYCCVMIAQAVREYWSLGKEKTCVVRRIPAVLEEKIDEEMENDGDSLDIEANVKDNENENEINKDNADDNKLESNNVEQVESDSKRKLVTNFKALRDSKRDPVVSDTPNSVKNKTLSRTVKKDKSSEEKTIVPKTLFFKDLKAFQKPKDTKAGGEAKSEPQDHTPMSIFADLEPGQSNKLNISIDELNKFARSIMSNLPIHKAFGSSDGKLEVQEPPITSVSKLLLPFEKDNDWYKIILKKQSPEHQSKNSVSLSHKLPEYQKGVFGTQSHKKFNFLRPPKPPLVTNIEFRSPTVWLPDDDKRLIHYVAEFCFNWDLIADHMLVVSSVPTLRKYESNIERRTPWQCFERYIQLNLKFQFSDMKGIYSFHAQQWLEQAHRTQLTTKRRVSPLGVANDSIQRGHRKLRWASMFDAMRKAMKKREIALAKLNHRKNTNELQNSQQQNSAANLDKRGNLAKVPTSLELFQNSNTRRDRTIAEGSRQRIARCSSTTATTATTATTTTSASATASSTASSTATATASSTASSSAAAASIAASATFPTISYSTAASANKSSAATTTTTTTTAAFSTSATTTISTTTTTTGR
ncbi:hypothetical protein LELG_05693 [Lodderomyces elongisporus NRRL YB-4239]|uniref:Chromatin modification-related protein EAF1 n=1 Tax=Lodderomyces elongisporus (strain ATCC 11503 / CBS 2605 / JCM 1781 / NBRC 1676 / NRRL YB-4239) TaxID=379508 RepID=A5E7V4_LODEL|nr:hypothetical protein LELG_05693 [Lodderomyces elongisporus NRRL YB-4239]